MKRIEAAALGLILIGIPLYAGQGKGNNWGRDNDRHQRAEEKHERKEERKAEIRARKARDHFDNDDHVIVRGYFAGPRGEEMRREMHRGDLPPGLIKQLRRRGHIPPGLRGKIMPFPMEYDDRFAPLPPGLQRGYIGGRAVIYDPGSWLIFDVFVAF
ncbi:MAG: hypothetical protein ABFD89_07920 [Bryobacteraceae bacterium]